MEILTTMINNNEEAHSLKDYLEAEIATLYHKELNSSLYEERMHISNESNYTWSHHKDQFMINYTLLPVGGHLQRTGLVLSFVTEITND